MSDAQAAISAAMREVSEAERRYSTARTTLRSIEERYGLRPYYARCPKPVKVSGTVLWDFERTSAPFPSHVMSRADGDPVYAMHVVACLRRVAAWYAARTAGIERHLASQLAAQKSRRDSDRVKRAEAALRQEAAMVVLAGEATALKRRPRKCSEAE